MTTLSPDTGVGPLLRGWRELRRISQLDLALRADSSARHISFVETGRSRPSEEMILRLADHLDIPVRERNALLVIAGYAPRYPQTPLDDPAMASVREGLDRLLAGYEPYPALVVDGRYDVVAANRGIALLMEGIAEELLVPPLNAMRITLHPAGLAPRILNLPEWRADLLAQMERQIALVRSPELRTLYEEVAAYPVEGRGAEAGGGTGGGTGARDGGGGDETEAGGRGRERTPSFALPLVIEHGGRVLSFIASIATFNTPMDVTVAELAVETFLPADRETAAYLRERLA
ncbi:MULTISPECIES: helix-turn-helix transcriptional regulator [unclassified Streptomyces]|uniref:helix-turn-helix domain-containing protein n=1 Tax=Streptomyces TaxID=1883 RepID=UPI000823ACFC|nr:MULTISPECIES: helix-turn-helix transcriptional regulator [unclassified Streptomyces]ARI51374.1 transcriptional regulator [Streptomyces sp. S8]MYT96020.1 helix-turn-helix domain-containing protein [Streptomyces sp. SID8350]SCK45650.1 Predicted transcriptional regulator [Streptomyces sp. AmelKG-D3]